MITPEADFYLFGMGNRKKMIYKQGHLLDAINNTVIKSWDVRSTRIHHNRYSVILTCPHGSVEITEDEHGVSVMENGDKTYVTTGELTLPEFANKKNAKLLRMLHHEILYNIVNGEPLPNLFVYAKPWYRDAAMMCMCLEKTGNLHLVKDWINSLRKPYDQNNAEHMEPDNLGQVLYMISLVSGPSHTLVPVILEEAQRIRKDDYITGISDFQEHPVYQTKWLKYGLARMGLKDGWKIPAVSDSYSQLFWMDYRNEHIECERFRGRTVELYPYLGWAQAHFYDSGLGADTPLGGWPLTWECEASQADYEGIRRLSSRYADAKYCAPHTWHCAEAFLYLYDIKDEYVAGENR